MIWYDIQIINDRAGEKRHFTAAWPSKQKSPAWIAGMAEDFKIYAGVCSPENLRAWLYG